MTELRSSGGGHVAYLVSQYPAYSHAFIELEIQALRRLGWRVDTYSVNLPGIPDHMDTGSTVSAKAQSRLRLLGGTIRFVAMHPQAVLGVARKARGYASGRGRPLKRAVWQGFYLVQAIFFFGILRQTGARQIHVHFANSGADIARLIVDLGRQVDPRGQWGWSMQTHGPTDFKDSREWGLQSKIASAAFVTCISEYALEEVRRRARPEDRAKISVVHMGINPDTLSRASPPVEGDPSRFRILFVGRLVPEKGPRILIEALAGMTVPAGQEVELVIVGDGPLREALRKAAESVPLPKVIRFMGALSHDDVLRWHRWADVFCLPSFSEGLPVVLMEALGNGIPVITTPVAGIPELVEHEVSGLLITPGDVKALRDALERLLDDETLRRRMGDEGRAVVMRTFVAEANARRLSRLLADDSRTTATVAPPSPATRGRRSRGRGH